MRRILAVIGLLLGWVCLGAGVILLDSGQLWGIVPLLASPMVAGWAGFLHPVEGR